ncbi:hypothetical protein ACQUW5_04680 [Legionella sp. CNM-1927-20]|uniref:hypothetical protein n=1 Tax=Legionella sp. CNM-1927-20 TaxID=3422221 RepID=UPI00403B0F1D
MKIDIVYAIEDNVLVILCAHGSMGAQVVSPQVGAKAWNRVWDRKELPNSTDESSVAVILENAFNKIKVQDNYQSVRAVIFASDVNLGFSGQEKFPHCVCKDFIEHHFSYPIKRVLFSSTQSIVDRAAQEIRGQNIACVKSTTRNPNEVYEAILEFKKELTALLHPSQNVPVSPSQNAPVASDDSGTTEFGNLSIKDAAISAQDDNSPGISDELGGAVDRANLDTTVADGSVEPDVLVKQEEDDNSTVKSHRKLGFFDKHQSSEADESSIDIKPKVSVINQ